jgi:hypothetical protein
MMRYILAAVLGFAAITLVGFTATAEEKKDEKKTLTGTLICTKCSSGETTKCEHALIVKEGDKKVTYYIADKGGAEPYHAKCCRDDVPDVKVTGKIVEKDKKKTIQEPKVEFPKKD